MTWILILENPKVLFRNVRWWLRKREHCTQPRGCPNPPLRFSAPSPRRRSLWVQNTQRQPWAPGRGNQVSRARRPQAEPRGPAPRAPQPRAAPRAPPAAASAARRWASYGGARKVTAVAFLSARCLRDLMYFIRHG